MKITEVLDITGPSSKIVFEGTLQELKQIYGRSQAHGKSGGIKKRFRCSSGPRKGRIVADPSTCTKPLDVKRSYRMKKTRRKSNTRMTRRAQITKKYEVHYPENTVTRRITDEHRENVRQ